MEYENVWTPVTCGQYVCGKGIMHVWSWNFETGKQKHNSIVLSYERLSIYKIPSKMLQRGIWNQVSSWITCKVRVAKNLTSIKSEGDKSPKQALSNIKFDAKLVQFWKFRQVELRMTMKTNSRAIIENVEAHFMQLKLWYLNDALTRIQKRMRSIKNSAKTIVLLRIPL